MNLKKFCLILSIFLILISLFSVYATNLSENTNSLNHILDSTNESDLTGCCSIALQLNETDSIMAFRRDSNETADIFIEEIDWHGMSAIKQYKTEGGYFCQVIITQDGWVIGYGGIDDGVDNKKIENITSTMITKDNSINKEKLLEIQQIKKRYKIGHLLIKAPNGNYGIATANTSFTGQLHPGEYVSIPNTEKYFRSGNISLNDEDKIKDVIKLAASDEFGLSRRDITAFNIHLLKNDTDDRNIIDAFVSNDDGSYYNMDCSEYRDNVYFNKTLFSAENIPICPNYDKMGSYELTPLIKNQPLWIVFAFFISCVALISALYFIILKIVRYFHRKFL